MREENSYSNYNMIPTSESPTLNSKEAFFKEQKGLENGQESNFYFERMRSLEACRFLLLLASIGLSLIQVPSLSRSHQGSLTIQYDLGFDEATRAEELNLLLWLNLALSLVLSSSPFLLLTQDQSS